MMTSSQISTRNLPTGNGERRNHSTIRKSSGSSSPGSSNAQPQWYSDSGKKHPDEMCAEIALDPQMIATFWKSTFGAAITSSA